MRTRTKLLGIFSAALLAGAWLAGCGGGGGEGSSEPTGQAFISLTDADGDFLRYEVDATSLTLTRRDGATVEALPVKTRIDFAQLTELTEFLTAATIPQGVYKSASLTLDYSQADIQVEKNGLPVPVALPDIRDADGNVIAAPLQVEVKLDNLNQHQGLPIAPGTPAHLALDFDLSATNHVDLSGAAPLVTVEPILVADVNPLNWKPHRVRGPLVAVDPDSADRSFQISVRPFRRVGDFGLLKVATDGNTVFEVNGVSAQGTAGWDAFKVLPTLTAVVVVGNFDSVRRFTATEVYAGSSVPGGTLDGLTGLVIARSDDSLTVRGAMLDRAAGSVTRNADVTVNLGTGTKVTKQGQGAASFTTGDVSVGQWIAAVGALSQDNATLDATAGVVRLLVTPIAGTIEEGGITLPGGGSPGGLTLNLQHLGGRLPSIFDFTGAGAQSHDVTASNYLVGTETLGLSGLTAGTPVRVRGFVSPFGQPDGTVQKPDFQAVSVTDLSDVWAALWVQWNPSLPGYGTPVTVVGTTGLDLNLAGSPLFHHVFRRGIATALTGTPRIVPADEGKPNRFAIRQGRSVTVYFDFASFAADLGARLTPAAPATPPRAVTVSAIGGFDDGTGTLTARALSVVLK